MSFGSCSARLSYGSCSARLLAVVPLVYIIGDLRLGNRADRFRNRVHRLEIVFPHWKTVLLHPEIVFLNWMLTEILPIGTGKTDLVCLAVKRLMQAGRCRARAFSCGSRSGCRAGHRLAPCFP